MFGWFKTHTPPPPKAAANPGIEHVAQFGTTDCDGTASRYSIDLVDLLARVLQDHHRGYKRRRTWIELDSGLALQPGYVSLGPANANQLHTVTTIETSRPGHIPSGVFEYQHGFGKSPIEAMADGFEGWLRTDLPVFEDALRARPVTCTLLEMQFPATESRQARKRRIVLGPVDHRASRDLDPDVADEHPFCACCMCRTLMEPLRSRIESGATFGIRFFAARTDGIPKADCRINGEDWLEGIEALKAYVSEWPDRGLELRKQYVLIQNVP